MSTSFSDFGPITWRDSPHTHSASYEAESMVQVRINRRSAIAMDMLQRTASSWAGTAECLAKQVFDLADAFLAEEGRRATADLAEGKMKAIV